MEVCEPVDKPNRARGGISSVTRLKLAAPMGSKVFLSQTAEQLPYPQLNAR